MLRGLVRLVQWSQNAEKHSGIPKRRLGEGRFGPREGEAQQNRHNMMLGQNISEVLSPRITGAQPGSQQYTQLVSDLNQLKAELEAVPLSQLGNQLDELMGTSPRSARGTGQQRGVGSYVVAAPRAADIRGRRGPNGQFFYK